MLMAVASAMLASSVPLRTFTDSAAGRRRRPAHAGQGVALMYASRRSLTNSLSLSSKRRLRFGSTPSNFPPSASRSSSGMPCIR
jgi:hypothetical protein